MRFCPLVHEKAFNETITQGQGVVMLRSGTAMRSWLDPGGERAGTERIGSRGYCEA